MLKLFRRWFYPKDEARTIGVLEDAVQHIKKETGAAIIIIIAVDDATSNIDICTNEGVNMIGALDYIHKMLIHGSEKDEYTKYECKQHIDLWLERLSVIEQQEHQTTT